MSKSIYNRRYNIAVYYVESDDIYLSYDESQSKLLVNAVGVTIKYNGSNNTYTLHQEDNNNSEKILHQFSFDEWFKIPDSCFTENGRDDTDISPYRMKD